MEGFGVQQCEYSILSATRSFYLDLFFPLTVNIIKIAFQSLLLTLLYPKPMLGVAAQARLTANDVEGDRLPSASDGYLPLALALRDS
jgi:hypothetical protein